MLYKSFSNFGDTTSDSGALYYIIQCNAFRPAASHIVREKNTVIVITPHLYPVYTIMQTRSKLRAHVAHVYFKCVCFMFASSCKRGIKIALLSFSQLFSAAIMRHKANDDVVCAILAWCKYDTVGLLSGVV